MLLHEKTSYRIVKSDSFDDATILLPDTQVGIEEDDINTNTIIHNENADNLSIRETATNTTADKHDVNDITTFIERKFNDLSQIKDSVNLRIDSMLNNINNCGLSKTKNVDVLNQSTSAKLGILVKIYLFSCDTEMFLCGLCLLPGKMMALWFLFNELAVRYL